MYVLKEKWQQKGWTIAEANGLVFLIHASDKITIALLTSEIDWWWDTHRIAHIDKILESQVAKSIVQGVNTYLCPN